MTTDDDARKAGWLKSDDGSYKAHAQEDGSTFARVLTNKDVEMLQEIHAWLAEIMPAARVAIKMMNAKNQLMGRWLGKK